RLLNALGFATLLVSLALVGFAFYAGDGAVVAGSVVVFLSALVFYLIGGNAFLGVLSAVGLAETLRSFVRVAVDVLGNVLGAVGFELSTADAVPNLVTAVKDFTTWSLLGIGVGASVWVSGTRLINSDYVDVYTNHQGSIEDHGRRLLGVGTDDATTKVESDGGTESEVDTRDTRMSDESDFYTLTYGEGGSLLVEPNSVYYSTNLLVGNASLLLHHGSRVDMVKRESYVSDSTKELYYDQVASVDYNDPYLEIRFSDGETFRFISAEKPESVLEDVQTKLQEYKQV
ncbi:MAG: hypothetical protein SV760_01810, partial [Halobacteria archaeon]|nr:hypothetical protein [Halobacteria archaeon]